MSVDWSMAAVAAALSIFAAPVAWGILRQVPQEVHRRRRQVLELKWCQIPTGIVHRPFYFNPQASTPYLRGKRAWSQCLITDVFKYAWNRLQASPRFVQNVPAGLPTNGSFICTDARLILAGALLYTDGGRKSTNPVTYAMIQHVGDIRICQIHCSQRQFRDTLTKSELEGILDGYPPWYRELFTTNDGINLQFPIRDVRDIPRGGWIVAVGLMDNLRHRHQEPLKWYRPLDEPDMPGYRREGIMYRMAIVRCRDHIKTNIQPHFIGDRNIDSALTALEYLIRTGTGSGLPYGNLEHRPVVPMRGFDCRLLMQNFSDYSELSPAQVETYSRIMAPAMTAVVHGAFEVVQYLKDVGQKLRIPPGLGDFDREIYLKLSD